MYHNKEHDEIIKGWLGIFKAKAESGLTVKEWCDRNGIRENQYYYWLRTARKEALLEKDRAKTERKKNTVEYGTFVEIKCPPAAKPDICGDVAHVPAAVLRKGDVAVELYGNMAYEIINRLLESGTYA